MGQLGLSAMYSSGLAGWGCGNIGVGDGICRRRHRYSCSRHRDLFRMVPRVIASSIRASTLARVTSVRRQISQLRACHLRYADRERCAPFAYRHKFLQWSAALARCRWERPTFLPPSSTLDGQQRNPRSGYLVYTLFLKAVADCLANSNQISRSTKQASASKRCDA